VGTQEALEAVWSSQEDIVDNGGETKENTIKEGEKGNNHQTGRSWRTIQKMEKSRSLSQTKITQLRRKGVERKLRQMKITPAQKTVQNWSISQQDKVKG
jgi:hypothetical protein